MDGMLNDRLCILCSNVLVRKSLSKVMIVRGEIFLNY